MKWLYDYVFGRGCSDTEADNDSECADTAVIQIASRRPKKITKNGTKNRKELSFPSLEEGIRSTGPTAQCPGGRKYKV